MPSNNILINYTISCEVHDDKMPKLIKWLEKNQQKATNTHATTAVFRSHKTA
jgi:hypothetical protein